MAGDEDFVSATGLALATIAGLIERLESVPNGEVARLLTLMAQAASPDKPRQADILKRWAQFLETNQVANDR